MEKLLKVLKKSRKISAWKINVVETESTELFYVLKNLETNRATNTIDYNVTIYVDKDGKRGSATFTYYPYMDEEEIQNKIEENVFAASFTMNKFFDIPGKSKVKIEKSKSNLKKKPFNVLIEEVANAVFKADKYKQGYLSATEIFLYKITNTVINSKGVKVSSVNYRGAIETIPSWDKGQEEVEVYNMIDFGSLDKKDITKQVKEALELAKARSRAKKLNAKKLVSSTKAIIQNNEVAEIFMTMAKDLNYATKYQHMNMAEIGQSVQGDNIVGDKLNLKLVPQYNGAIKSSAVDADGVVLKEVSLIEDGIAKANWGSYRFGFYLGVDNPTGELPVAVVKEGTKSFEEMKKSPYIRCVRFSSFQLDPYSGLFGGEVRLGFYFDGKKEVPVTGFSITGNFNELKSKFVYSSDTVTLPNYHGPKYIEINDIDVA
jgi:predicted Zn-dependent protease